MALTSPRPVSESPATAAVDRGGSIGLWAVLGTVGIVIALQTWVRWVTSGHAFDAAPILGPDHFPTWRLVALRISEGLSVVEMSVLMYAVVVVPLRRTGRLGLEAKVTVGCLIGCVSDGVLNMHQYLFAWNAHSINRGSWAEFLPTASPSAHTRYAEALVWGVPMYTYFCIGVAFAGLALIKRLRARNPEISNARALATVFGCAFVFDFVVENIFIRIDHGYAFAKTASLLTIDDGSQYQFPIYESVFVALLGVLFTSLRLSAHDSTDGVSYVEGGVRRFKPRYREPLSWFAVIGFSMTCLFIVYHLPLNWLGVTGNSIADLPSYMLPGP
jgi:hypothetical protein